MPASLHVGGYAKLAAKFLQEAFYKEHRLTRDSIGLLEQTYVSNGAQTYEVRFSASVCIPIPSFKLEPTATPPPSLPNLLQRLAVGQHVTLSQGVDAGHMEFYAKHGVTREQHGCGARGLPQRRERYGVLPCALLSARRAQRLLAADTLLQPDGGGAARAAASCSKSVARPTSSSTGQGGAAGGQASPLSELGAMWAGLTEAFSTPPAVPTGSRLAAIPRDDGALSAITGVMDAPLLDLFTAAGTTGVPNVDAHAFMALEKAEELQAHGQLGELTIDEAAAIALYTAECNFYSTLNRLLSQRDRLALAPFLPFLRLMLQARRKLPTHTQAVWRGVKGVDLTSDFPKGKKLFWWAFTSTSKHVSTLLNPAFCGTSGTRTQFMIEASSGVDIVRMQRQLQPCGDSLRCCPYMSLFSPF